MSDVREIVLVCPKCNEAFKLKYSPYAPEKTVKCTTCGTDIPLPQRDIPTLTAAPAPATPVPEPARKGSLTGRIVAGIVGGFILAALTSNIVGLVLADLSKKEQSGTVTRVSGVLALCLFVAGIVIAVKAPRPAKAWRRLLIPSGILSLVLPLAIIVPTVRMADQASSRGGQMEAGVYALGGIAMACVVGFLCIILAAIFLTIGLLVGRDRKV